MDVPVVERIRPSQKSGFYQAEDCRERWCLCQKSGYLGQNVAFDVKEPGLFEIRRLASD